MALGDSYATLTEIKTYTGNASTAANDDALEVALETASRGIESVCHRQFNKATEATARVYRPLHSTLLHVDDFHTTTGLVVKTDTAGDGTYATTWAAGEFESRPLNGVVLGQPGWPFYELWSDGSRLFPCERFASVEVTAAWGWSSVPGPVKSACLIVAAETWKLKDAPFGVAGVGGDLGVLRVRENPLAMKKLAPYVRYPVAVA